MALAVTATFTIFDGVKSSKTEIKLPTAPTLVAISEAALSAAQLIANVTRGVIQSVTVCIGLDISGATIAAAASVVSDIAQKAYFGFRTAVAGFFDFNWIPAFDESLLIGDNVDQSNADVAAFVSAMEGGVTTTGGVIQPVNNRGYDVDTLKEAYQSFRAK